ncbi:MAG: hypothetical protein Q8S84_01680 [bacterium]|nr:hypothetical protein [bacterium]MDP3380274.1 hypothetical protein [bacterium]
MANTLSSIFILIIPPPTGTPFVLKDAPSDKKERFKSSDNL